MASMQYTVYPKYTKSVRNRQGSATSHKEQLLPVSSRLDDFLSPPRRQKDAMARTEQYPFHNMFGTRAAISSSMIRPSMTSTGTPINQAGHAPARKRTHTVAMAPAANNIDDPRTPSSAERSLAI